MVSLLVDTVSFVEAGSRAAEVARSADRALSRAASGLGGLSHMAGSDSNGLKWAGAYDHAAGQLFGYGAQLHDAVSTVARNLTVTGYYYEVAELTNAGQAVELVLPAPIVVASRPHVPSAAGGARKFPSTNPVNEWIVEQIANLVGEMWPDGDTGKLDEASRVWHAFADDLDDIASGLSAVKGALDGVDTPELPRIHDAIDGVRTFAKKLATASRELGKAANTLSGKIAYVHTQTEITIGITVIAIAATVGAALGLTVFTFGISDAVGVAGVAGETAGAAATITGFIGELAATISSAVGGITASAAGLVGISADMAATIGVTVGDVTATAVLWGYAGAAENTIVTAVTEPGSDLFDAAGDGFINWGIGGAVGGVLGKTALAAGGGAGSTVDGIVGSFRLKPFAGSSLAGDELDAAEIARRDPNTGNQPDGSWAGKGGLRLDPQDNQLVQQYAAESVKAEQGIRPGLQSLVEGGSPHAHLVGLDDSVKFANSLKDKVAQLMEARPDQTVGEALDRVKDSVRYTAEIPGDSYSETVIRTVDGLKAEGYQMVADPSNTWMDAGYKGINSSWEDPATGKVFEVQFHTPESFTTKTVSHDLYVEMKVPGISRESYAALKAENDQLFENLTVPPGAAELWRMTNGG